MAPLRPILALGAGLAALAACGEVQPRPETASSSVFKPEYLGIETRKLDSEIVSFLVRMSGARGNDDIEQYGRCAAAQYALIRGYGFARHLRTNVQERGGIWAADAVYTISAALPDGLQTIDAEVAVEECAENGIPTV